MIGWYCQAKETKRGGMVYEESECLIVLMKLGNFVQETQWREGGTMEFRIVGGKDVQLTGLG